MKHSYEQLQKEIRRRTRQYRKRLDQAALAILSLPCLILSSGMLPLLSHTGIGVSTVPGGYSSELECIYLYRQNYFKTINKISSIFSTSIGFAK